MPSDPPKVFISYTHDTPEHKARVLDLANRLCAGIDVQLDQYEPAPETTWPRWMEDGIERADFVLVVATETYARRYRGHEDPGKGLGAQWEGEVITQAFYEGGGRNSKFIAVIFEPDDKQHIPSVLRGFTWHHVGDAAGYETLYRRLTGQPEVVKPEVGERVVMPPSSRGTASTTVAEPTVSIARLPITGELFVGRERELARLDEAWADPATNVISFVAFGGVGKSTLINRWLDGLAADGWRGARRVFGWSFYNQGTDATGTSGDPFVEAALKEFGYRGEPLTSPWEKGRELARLVRAERTLLVLDGLEPLQHPPGIQTGRLKDPALQALVRELAAKNPGLCVISTRLPVADVAGRGGAVAVDLERLPAAAGAALLRQLGVEGSQAELEEASRELDGHGLTLTLLGTYLRDICDGDVRRRGEVSLLDEEIEQGDRARRVMAAYAAWLGQRGGEGPSPELQVLRLVGLFDRPAEAAAVAALRASPAIPGLTEGLGTGEKIRWRRALARLRQARLLAAGAGADLDAHPLVREYFGERLRQEQPNAWRSGHERLYEHYKSVAPELPETLEAMQPLYTAVVHGCRAGWVQKACDEVFLRRIRRGSEGFSWRKFGAFSSELTALAAFFECPWDQPSDQLTVADQAWILHAAGFVLRALGRLPEAVQPMRECLDRDLASVETDWVQAAKTAGNLSGLSLTLGKVMSAVETGEESVELADRSGDAFMRMVNRGILADALHQVGRREESASAFREAEAMQAEIQPQNPRLGSIGCYLYCDLLLSMAEPGGGSGRVGPCPTGGATPVKSPGRFKAACEGVRERTSEAIRWEQGMSGARVLDFALFELAHGRAYFGLDLTSDASPDFTDAAHHLDRAVDGLRQAGTEHHLPRGLLARAALHHHRGDTSSATADLREALDLAERGHMRLHEADAHLEWTRLNLTAGDRDAARRHLEVAREIVEATGYGRRTREVTWLASELAPE